jgi:hypothetical protein
MGAGAHAHFCLQGVARSGLLIRLLIEHVEQMCRHLGIERWTGQINGRGDQRRRVLAAYDFHPVASQRNRTLSWLVGEPVYRHTFLRRAGALTRVDEALPIGPHA